LASKIESTEYTELDRVFGWFIVLRWIAFAGVAVTLAAVRLLELYELPFGLLFAITGLLGLLNLSFTAWLRLGRRGALSRRQTAGFFHAQVVCDFALLFLLVYFTGFLENPFCYFFVFHILLAAFIFSSRVVYAYVGALVALVAGAFLAEYLGLIPHFRLWSSPAGSYLSQNLPRAAGLASLLLISAYLITSIKRRLEEKGQRIEVELDRYKNLDKIKSNFILQVTHELRGPIAAVSGYHEMLLRGIGGPCPPKALEIVGKADHRIDNLLTIIDEMIDYAYMKSQEEVRPARSRLALRGAIEQNLELLETQAAAKQIALAANCPKDLFVPATRDLLKIILGNLVHNAIKYSPPRTTVSVTAQAEGPEVHILVQDQGYGIEAEELEKIFEEFYRTRAARELERDGTGLGLSIVKRAVESLAGRISVYSVAGQGTTFHIFLPVSEAKDEQDPDHR
jgi:signal transduction histidine kinase